MRRVDCRCPGCGERSYVHSALADGHAVLWLHCFACGWDSERVNVWGLDDLKEKYGHR